MKKLLLLILGLFLSSQTIKAQVVLDANGVTIKWTGTTVPSPYFVQASPRGTLEWFAIVSDATKSNISDYAGYTQTGIAYFTRPGSSTPIPFNNIITSLVTDMSFMFANNFYFNQDISSWDVSNVINMNYMFSNTAFNQNISSWNVSKVTSMTGMFRVANTFNQPIGSWDVSNVTDMYAMFDSANTFNQPIGSWNVSKVRYMDNMFSGNTSLSIANYDSLLIGWSTITSTETPLLQGVFFVGGNAKFCKGASARADIINTYGWIITDGGLDCSTSVEELESSKVKQYPNPVISELNVNVDYHLIDEPYVIIDGLGRVVLEGKFKEVESTINLKELAKGIYYLKTSNSYSSKFIKE